MIIKLKERQIEIPEGKPVIVRWKSMYKQRSGISSAIGWIKKGPERGQIQLIHSCYQADDSADREYPSSWKIYVWSIVDIKLLTVKKGV